MDTKDAENISSDESSQRGDKRKAKEPEKQTERKKSKTTGGSKKIGTFEVWQHFGKKFVDEDGETRAKCNYCDKALVCHSRKDDTTSLKRHLASCPKHPSKLKDQCNLFVKKNEDGTGEASIKNWKFSAEKSRKAIAHMIILDELPFATLEKEGFRNLMETVRPNLKMPSRFTVAKDIGDLYLEEKAKLKSYFTNSKTKVSLTTDTWTSIQRINYMCVTSHFIDQDWVYHKRIIDFRPIYSHKGEEIARVLVQCLREWDIEYVLAIILDNASSNDSAITILKDKLPNQMVGGKCLHVRCMAHIINLIVKDGLAEKIMSVVRIRDAVRYVRQSSKRLDALKECAKKANVVSKAMVCLDVSTRWNSTYDILATAEKFKNAFNEYDLADSNFSRELDQVPRSSYWSNARMLADVLGLFKQKTNKASASTKAVVNEFFYETMDIDKHLRTLGESYDLAIKTMGGRMRLKFEKYWRDEKKFNNLLDFGSILDPRLKVRDTNRKVCYLFYSYWVIRLEYVLQGLKEFMKIKSLQACSIGDSNIGSELAEISGSFEATLRSPPLFGSMKDPDPRSGSGVAGGFSVSDGFTIGVGCSLAFGRKRF